MLITCMATGGVAYAGYKTYHHINSLDKKDVKSIDWKEWWKAWIKRLRKHSKMTSKTKISMAQTSEPNRTIGARPLLATNQSSLDETLPKRMQQSNQELTLASITLGLAASTLLFYPPAQILCLPLLLYQAIPSAKSAYHSLRQDATVTPASVETTLLSICIIESAYFAGALIVWCYVVGQPWWEDGAAKQSFPTARWQPPSCAWVEQAGVQSTVPVQKLHSGDIVVVHTGEMVPMAGIVTSGTAWVKQRDALIKHTPAIEKLEVGSRVEAMSIVQVGSISYAVA